MTISLDPTPCVESDYRLRTDLLQRLFPSIHYELTQIAAALSIESVTASRWLSLATPDLDEVTHAGRRASAQIARAANLLLDVAALGGTASSGIERIPVVDLLDQSVALAREALYRSRASVTVNVPHDLPEVHGDRVLAQHILLELLLHAVSEPAFEGAGCVIDVNAQRDDDVIHISIVRLPSVRRAARPPHTALKAIAIQAGGRLCPNPPSTKESVLSFPIARVGFGPTFTVTGAASTPRAQPAHPPA